MLMFGGGNAESVLGDLWTFVPLEPLVSVEGREGGIATIEWDPPLRGVVIEASSSVDPAEWSAIETDTRGPVTLPIGDDDTFFRVVRP